MDDEVDCWPALIAGDAAVPVVTDTIDLADGTLCLDASPEGDGRWRVGGWCDPIAPDDEIVAIEGRSPGEHGRPRVGQRVRIDLLRQGTPTSLGVVARPRSWCPDCRL